ncbi:hypothetical protein K4K61_004732 [Colletotrichum sp. SAR11_59]|nr:hypothetical protein K4K61_004732 [Colletotrichum sp. SAR11_59]
MGTPARAGPLLLPLLAIRTHSSSPILVLWQPSSWKWDGEIDEELFAGDSSVRNANIRNLTTQLDEGKKLCTGISKWTMDVITESELAKHYEVHNLWVSIRGKVYDVSSYVDDHPGGVEVLKDVAGSDGTESFEYVGHSEDAYKTLAKFQIGVLEGETNEAAPISSQAWDVQRAQLQNASLKSKVAGWPVALTLLLSAGIVSRWLLRNQQAFTKTLEYYKEVWEYPSYFSCKANRANI